MTYKSSLAGLDLGGGKACIWKSSETSKDADLVFKKIGQWVEHLGGRYITAEDMGTSVENMRRIREFTKHVAGFPLEDGGSGDPSPWTALGVFHAIRAACEVRFGTQDVAGRQVALQGVGHVGIHLAEHLAQAGAKLVVSDTSEKNLLALKAKLEVEVLPVEAIYDAQVDVYSPCAIGQTVNRQTLGRLQAKIIAGAANNQLEHPGLYKDLADKNILYCPDFAINSGGVISCASEFIEQSSRLPWLKKKVDDIFSTCQKVLSLAREKNIPTEEVALALAKERLLARKQKEHFSS
jgi:leucine dehydrogenase